MNYLLIVQVTIIVSLILITQTLAVHVLSWDKKEAYFQTGKGESVSKLRDEIQRRWSVPVEDQRLISMNDKLLEDNEILNDNNEIFLKLENPLINETGLVYAKTKNGTEKALITMQVGANDTIDQLIMAIAANSNLPRDKIRLFFQGKELSDESQTVRFYKLYANSWLDIIV